MVSALGTAHTVFSSHGMSEVDSPRFLLNKTEPTEIVELTAVSM